MINNSLYFKLYINRYFFLYSTLVLTFTKMIFSILDSDIRQEVISEINVIIQLVILDI